jgi:hypothetical protein
MCRVLNVFVRLVPVAALGPKMTAYRSSLEESGGTEGFAAAVTGGGSVTGETADAADAK